MAVFTSFVDELEARSRIQDVLYRHSRGIDRNDHAGERGSAYHPDAIVESGFGPQPVAALIEARSSQHEHTRHSMHSVTNVLIEFVSQEIAFVESHVTAVEWELGDYDFASRGITDPGPAGARIISWCRYADVFERRDGTWRILERTVIFGDSTHEPLVADPVPPVGFQFQHHSAEDPMYTVLARARRFADARTRKP